jgi:hypothetical protein
MGTHRIENWPSAPATIAPELQKEFAAHAGDGRVGNELLSETDRVRVWAIGLKPGQRLGFHTHVLDYFWTSVTGGQGRARTSATARCRTSPTSQATSNTSPSRKASSWSTTWRTLATPSCCSRLWSFSRAPMRRSSCAAVRAAQPYEISRRRLKLPPATARADTPAGAGGERANAGNLRLRRASGFVHSASPTRARQAVNANADQA